MSPVRAAELHAGDLIVTAAGDRPVPALIRLALTTPRGRRLFLEQAGGAAGTVDYAEAERVDRCLEAAWAA